MEAWITFTVTVSAIAGGLALFLTRRHLFLLSIAAVAGIVAPLLFNWRTPQGDAWVIYVILILCVGSAILSYLWPWKAWQWGLVPCLAFALWQVMGPYSTVHWGRLGPLPYFFTFFYALLMAILPIVTAELAAYFTRLRQAKPTEIEGGIMSGPGKIAAIMLGALVGLYAFYDLVDFTACSVLGPKSNLCGLPAQLFVDPIGALVGAAGGWLIARMIAKRLTAHPSQDRRTQP